MAVLQLVRNNTTTSLDNVDLYKYQSELIESFIKVIEFKYADGTATSFHSALGHFLPWLEEKSLMLWDIKPADYDIFSNHLQQCIKVNTASRYTVLISNLYDWLVSRKKDEIKEKFGVDVVNPVDHWNLPKKKDDDDDLPELPDSEVVHYYLQKEKSILKMAIEKCDNRTASITARQLVAEYIMLKAGLRVAEIANLNVGHISLKDMILIVKRGKGNKDRIVDIPGDLGKLLQWYLDEAHPYIAKNRKIESNTPLFISEQGKRVSKKTIQHRLWTNQSLYNIPIDQFFSPHGLRRLYATNLYKMLLNENHPDPLTYIKIQLGHVFYSTTLRYCRVEKAIHSRSQNKAISSVKNILLKGDESV